MSVSQPINVFIPAAGRGERLLPVTDHIPKPLVPIMGKTVLNRVLDRLSELTINTIGINLHYKSEVLSSWVNQSPFKNIIHLFYETHALGTGGALKNAEKLLGQGTFLVHNADVVSDIDLFTLIAFHRSSENTVTLAVHECKEFNSLVVDDHGHLVRVDRQHEGKRLAYTGIALYEPAFLELIPEGTSSVVDIWMQAIDHELTIGTFDVSGSYWSDIGTAASYAASVFHALEQDGETVYVDPSVKGAGLVNPRGYIAIERESIIEQAVSLQNCVVLPGSRIGAGRGLSSLKNCIVGPDYLINMDMAEMFQVSGQDERQLIGTGGSDRAYYRVSSGTGTNILMESSVNDPEFALHIEYTRFFQGNSIPVPSLISVDAEKGQAVFEDAGDISLYSYLKFNRSKSDIHDMYSRALKVAAAIHCISEDKIQGCPSLENRIFDYSYFRWETEYFLSEFIHELKNITVHGNQELQEELDFLARNADAIDKTVIHRDFQSQNIMVMGRRELKVIDFQGARMGPAAYDVASILWDPYFYIEEDLREKLLGSYLHFIKEYLGKHLPEEKFMEGLVFCRLQRHMQALGAYGFLSRVKGKRHFLKFIPEGIRLLKEDILLVEPDYPALSKLIQKL